MKIIKTKGREKLEKIEAANEKKRNNKEEEKDERRRTLDWIKNCTLDGKGGNG